MPTRARGRARCAQRCSDVPRRRDPARVGVVRPRAAACSASERKPELTTSVTPARRAARGHPVERGGDVGAHRLPLPVGERARVAAAARHRRQRRPTPPRRRASPPPSAERAIGLRAAAARRCRRRARSAPRCPTRTRSGANEPGRGSATSTAARARRRCAAAASAAAARPGRDTRPCARCAGFGAPSGSARRRRTGAAKSSRIERAAESAARSAARCSPPAVAAPPIAARISADGHDQDRDPEDRGKRLGPLRPQPPGRRSGSRCRRARERERSRAAPPAARSRRRARGRQAHAARRSLRSAAPDLERRTRLAQLRQPAARSAGDRRRGSP